MSSLVALLALSFLILAPSSAHPSTWHEQPPPINASIGAFPGSPSLSALRAQSQLTSAEHVLSQLLSSPPHTHINLLSQLVLQALTEPSDPPARPPPPPPHVRSTQPSSFTTTTPLSCPRTCPPRLHTLLTSLYSSTGGGTTWHATNWNSSTTDCLSWLGVHWRDDCGLSLDLWQEHVTGLSGELPAGWMHELAALFPMGYSLGFSDNPALTGHLDAGFTLPGTSHVYLSGTGFSGVLPSTLTIPESSDLYVSSTLISGTLPPLLSMSRGATLHAHSTMLSGTLSPALCKLAPHSIVALYGTRVSGTLASTLALPEGAHLDLDTTLVSGVLPDGFVMGPSSRLWVYSTRLSGVLPSSMSLRHATLVLDSTFISGAFPSTLSVSGSSTISATRSLLSGPLPQRLIGDADAELTIDASGLLDVDGTLPELSPGSFRGIQLLISATSISGSVPASLGAKMTALEASSTLLSGALPDMPVCERLALANTFVQGELIDMRVGTVEVSQAPLIGGRLPDDMFAGGMSAIHISRTGVSGSIPDVPAQQVAGSMETLLLTFNQLEGTVPDSLCANDKLRVLSLTGNPRVYGTVPECLYQSVQRLELGSTGISSVPVSLVASPHLRVLGLGHTNVTLDVSATSPFCRAVQQSSIQAVDISGQWQAGQPGELEGKLEDFTRCVMAGTSTVASLQVRNRRLASSTCEVLSSNGEFVRSYDCNFLYPSPNVQSLALADANLRILRVRDGSQAREPTISDFPALEALDVSFNPRLSGRLPMLFEHLMDLDVSHTNYDVCASRSVFSAAQMHSIGIHGLSAPWSKCSVLVEPEETAVLEETGQVLADARRGNLQCPLWRLRYSTRGGFVNADSTFLEFFRCFCPQGLYFGRPVPTAVSDVSWSEYRDDVLDSDVFACRACPLEDLLECDTATDPRAAKQPKHRLVGSRFPVYLVRGEWVFLPERWRLVHAALLTCQHPDVCNVNADADDDDVRCRRGHDSASLLCSRCKRGYFHVGVKCQRCPGVAKWLVPLSFVLAALAYALLMAKLDFSEPSIAVSIWFFWLQLDGILTRVRQQLEARGAAGHSSSGDGFFAPIEQFMQTLASFHPFALQCVHRHADFVVQSYVLLLSPLVVAVVLGAAFVVSRLANGSAVRHLVEDWHLRPRWGTSLLFTWSVMLFPVAHRSFQAFSCESGDVAGRDVHVQYLSAAPWVDCGSREHVGLAVMAVLALLLFVVPALVLMWKRLKQYHREEDGIEAVDVDGVLEMYELMPDDEEATRRPRRMTTTHRSWTSFLAAPLCTRVWWWPVLVQQTRAMMLAMLVALVPFRSVYLPVSVFAVLLAALLVHVRVQPYRKPTDNHLESLVLVVALLRYMLSMLAGLSDDTSSEDVATLGSVLSLFVFVCVGVVLYHDLRGVKQEEEQEEEE